MDDRHPLLVICSDQDVHFYKNFPLPDEELLIVPHGQAACLVVRRRLDLILLDCGFDPRMGLQLLEEFRQRFPGVPIIFITEKSSEEIVIRAFKLGARDYIRKPMSTVDVRAEVSQLLELKRASAEQRDDVTTSLGIELPVAGHLSGSSQLPPSIKAVVRHIEDNYPDNINLDQMAEIAQLSKHHFVRFFQRQVGMTPVSYLKYVRVQRAKELLKRLELTVFAVAMQVGFRDISNFNKNFKKYEGINPSQYRASLSLSSEAH